MKLLFSVACFSLLSLTGHAQNFDAVRESLLKLPSTARPTVSTLSASTVMPGAGNIPARITFLDQSRAFTAQGNYASARQVIQNALASATSEAEKKLWQQLLDEVKAASKTQREAVQKKSDAFFEQLAKDVLKVKTSKELSALQERVTEFREEIQPFHMLGPEIQRIQNRINGATNFLQQYQRFVDAGEEDLVGQQLAAINDLIRNQSYNRLVSVEALKKLRQKVRSQLQQHFDRQSASIREQIKKAKTSANFEDISDALGDLGNEYSQANVSSFRESINQMRQTVRYAKRVLRQRLRENFQRMLYEIRNLRTNTGVDLSILPANWMADQATYAIQQLPASYRKDLDLATRQLKAWQADASVSGNLNTFARMVDAYADSLNDGMVRDDLYQFKSNLERLYQLDVSVKDNSSYAFDRAAARSTSFRHPWPDIADAYYQAAIIQGAEKLYHLKGFGKKVRKGERATDALRRLAVEAAQAKQWNQCHAYLEIVHNATKTCQGHSDFENLWNASTFYRQAKLLQEAGQKKLAIETYQKVLSIPGDNLPRAESIQAIQDLQK